uniref:NAD-dependent epimerase/dehydratase family protein n=1 Tax=Acetatifactor sp. TaxID=1872090 RepID=UPI0040564FB2
MKKVIITGADGFIGSNFVKKLVENHIEVWAVIYPQSKTKDRINGLEGVHCIEADISELGNRIKEFPREADAFYHFAWQGVNADERNDLELQLGNIDLCLQCIKLAADLNVRKFILPGSTSEYLYYGKPINEFALPSPQNAYGSVKVALRYLAEQYARQLKVSFVYVVITGIYAADRKDNNVIFYTIDKLLRGEKPSITKLEQLWDYVNIQDVVDALALVGAKGQDGAFYAIGHGDNQPLYKYIEIIHDYIDKSLPLGIGDVPYANDRLPSSCIDLTKIYEDTGFIPKVNFEDGIKEVIDMMKKEICNVQ